MFCSKCGKQISDDAKFCRFCGAPVEQITEKEIVVEEKVNTVEEPIVKEESIVEEPVVKEEKQKVVVEEPIKEENKTTEEQTVKEEVKQTTVDQPIKEEKKAEPTKQDKQLKAKKSKKPIIIITIILLLAAGIAAFVMFGMKSAETAVKDYIKAINEGNGKKAIEVTDLEGATAFMEALGNVDLSDTNDIDDKYLEDFDEIYEELMEEKKNMDKDEKEEYKEQMKEAEEYIEEYIEKIGEDADTEIINLKKKEVKGSKKLTKVTATIKESGKKQEVVFYTMKKGLKEYVVYPHIAMNVVIKREVYEKTNPITKYDYDDDDYSYSYDYDDYDYDYDDDDDKINLSDFGFDLSDLF